MFSPRSGNYDPTNCATQPERSWNSWKVLGSPESAVWNSPWGNGTGADRLRPVPVHEQSTTKAFMGSRGDLDSEGEASAFLRILTKEQKRCWIVDGETTQAEVNISLPLTLHVLQGSAVPQEGAVDRGILKWRGAPLSAAMELRTFSLPPRSPCCFCCAVSSCLESHTGWWCCCVMPLSPLSYWSASRADHTGRLAPLHTGMGRSHYFLRSPLCFPSSLLKLEDWWKIIDLKLLYKIVK